MCSAVGHGSASTPAGSAGLQSGDGHHHRSTTSFLTKRTSSSSLLLTLIAAAPPAETAISAWIPPRSEWTGTMMVSSWMEAYIFVSARPPRATLPSCWPSPTTAWTPSNFPPLPRRSRPAAPPFSISPASTCNFPRFCRLSLLVSPNTKKPARKLFSRAGFRKRV